MIENLLFAIIGLVRSMENNEGTVTDHTHLLVLNGYIAYDKKDIASAEMLYPKIREEKRRLVPNCFECTAPCGRTEDCTRDQLWSVDEEINRVKIKLISLLSFLSYKTVNSLNKDALDLIYRATFVLGIDYWEKEKYEKILKELQSLVNHSPI